MTCIVLGIRVPTPDMDAGSLRMLRLLMLLREHQETVGFVPCFPFHQAPYGNRLDQDIDRLQRLGIRIAPPPGDPADFGQWFPEHDTPDLVILSDEWVAHHFLDPVRRRWPEACVVFDTVDLHHIRLFREARITRNRPLIARALAAKQRELRATANADITLVVSVDEQRTLSDEVPGSDIRVLPTIHASPDQHAPGFHEREGLLFVGSFDHNPNRDAVHFLLESLLPDVRNCLPHVPLTIVGANPPESLARMNIPGVSVAGHVPDLVPYYNRARLLVAPLRFGAGIKGKVLDAMAHGLPVVGNEIAAEGIPCEDMVHMAIADVDRGFAEKVQSVYTDPIAWKNVQQNGRELVRKHFSLDTARVVVQSLLREATQS